MKELDIRQIEIFLAVAKYHSISQAANALFTSQPSVSNWIARMENDCGVKLFNRSNKGITLTPEGEEMYARLDIAYQRFRVSVEEICRPSPDADKRLRIGYLHRSEFMKAAEKAVEKYQKARPDVSLHNEMYNFNELRDKLMCDQLDLILSVSYDIIDHPYLDYIYVGKTEYSYFVPPVWAKDRENFDPEILNGRTLILEMPSAEKSALAICEKDGIVPSDIRFVNSYMHITTLVSRGEGFSLDSGVNEKSKYKPDLVEYPSRSNGGNKIVCAWRKGHLSPLAKDFLSVVYYFETV